MKPAFFGCSTNTIKGTGWQQPVLSSMQPLAGRQKAHPHPYAGLARR
jgi:hypothetical protein